jgi:hypothetical protein
MTERAFFAIAAAIVVFFAYLIATVSLAPDHLAFLLSETGPLESAGALFCVLAAGVFLYAFIVETQRHGLTMRSIWILGLGLGAAFLFLEEVSWGQHIFGFEPPAAIAQRSAQREFNLHNLEPVHRYAHAAGFGLILIYFVMLPIARESLPSVRAAIDRLSVPVPDLRLSLLFILTIFLFQAFQALSAGHVARTGAVLNRSEARECVYELILLLLALGILAPVNRPRR